MGLFTFIAEKAAVSTVTAAFPPAGWVIKAWSWLTVSPVRMLAAALLLLSLYTWHLHSALGRDERTIASFKTAQKIAAVVVRKDTVQAVTAVDKLNGVTEHDYEDGLAQGRAELAAYVAAHRMRGDGASAGGRPAPAPGDQTPSVPAVAGSAAPTVAFTEAELSVWDKTWEDDHECRAWAEGVAAMFDGKHWPTPAEVTKLQPVP